MKLTKYYNVYAEGSHLYRLIDGKFHRLSEFVDNVGYYQTVFTINGKRKHVRIHRVIAETLIPNPLNLPQVNHKDGNKLNNEPSNLEWCTNSYNTKDGYEKGCYYSKKRSHKVRVTFKDGRIRIYKSIRECAEKLGLNRKTITSVLKGNKKNNYVCEFEYVDECID